MGKNRDDGRVEILAEGPEESLKNLPKRSEKGAPSNVTGVTVEESRHLKGYRTFSISY